MKRLARIRLLAAALVATLTLAACGPGEPAADAGPVKLVYWSWAPEIESIVAIWNQNHPDVQVEVSTAAGFSEFNAKLLAAYQAGNPPDVNNTSYQNLPLLVSNGVVADLTETMGPLQQEFSPVAWQMVSFDGAVYGVPQATTPNLLFYRKDLFAKYGIEPPTTWTEYAAAARAVHAEDPDVFLANIDLGGAFGFFTAMGQQNGVQPWTLADGTWTVGLNSPEAKEMIKIWGDLIADGVIATHKSGSPELNAAVADGKILSTIDSVWAPISMAGYAPDTKNQWGVTIAPQLNPERPVSGVLGGSATVVSSISKHPKEAAEFARWLNYSDESLQAYIKKVSIYPAKLSARSFPELRTPPPLISDVSDFYQLAGDIDRHGQPVTWGPNAATAQEIFGKELGAALVAGGDTEQLQAALDRVQEQVVADLKKSGYEVAGG
ncbi:ABC transporter substrate-binding protein [Microlunatus sp. GCM10028923]|uniref:ABC transporter substrate-binding protein n=1 Tax=Microlunatus sp. GCM10028923 TaxID=3273400 RepID=UPI0036137B7A